MSQARREVPTEGAFGAAIESQGKRKCSERASDTVTLCEPEPDTPPRSPRRRQHTHPQPTTGRDRPGAPEGGRAGTSLPAGGGGGAARGQQLGSQWPLRSVPSTGQSLSQLPASLTCSQRQWGAGCQEGPLGGRPDHLVDLRGVAEGDRQPGVL